MKIGELSKQSGMAAHTIRFYESKGLLPKVNRALNGYRSYTNESYQRLIMIQCAKNLGFSLDSIAMIVAEQDATSLDHDKILCQLDQRLSEVDLMMGKLEQQRKEIQLFKVRLKENWQVGKCMQADEISQLNIIKHQV